MSATTVKHRPIILTRYAEPSSVFAPQPFPLGSFAVRSLQMAQSGPGGVSFRLLMIIGMIALARGLSPAQAKHGPGWAIQASTVGAIRVGTWAGTSTAGSI